MTLPIAFKAFSPLHALSAGICVAIIAVLCWRGRMLLPTGREPAWRRLWLVGLYLIQAANVLYYLAPGRFDPAVSFPFHVCDLAGLIAVGAMHTRARWLRTALVYFGLSLCTQAFFTPTVTVGPAHAKFWLFWATHTQIVGSAMYEVLVLRYRSAWRDYAAALLMLLAYGVFVIPLDWITGWNYGYAGPTVPGTPTLVNKLGPWPQRLIWMWLIAQTAFTILTLFLRPRANHHDIP